jgi:hypothetical protein
MATKTEILALINGIGTGSPNSASEMRDLLTAMMDPPIGTIRMRDVSNAYITANFDGTGKGINEELGYAILNGQNGTRNWNDRTLLAYGTSNLVMGAQKGSNTHTLLKAELPSYNLELPVQNISSGSPGNNVQGTGSSNPSGTALIPLGGSGTAFSIENKSIVTLVTMFIGYD